MRASDLWVRRFRSADQEREFRLDYAQRLSTQRKLTIAIFTALWIFFSIVDFTQLDTLDPVHLHHNELIFVRTAAAIGMGIAVLLWTPRALDERGAVGLLCLWTLSAWLGTLRMMQIEDPRFQHSVYQILTLTLFMIFMAFRLRAVTTVWLVGLCVVSYLLMLFLEPPGEKFGMHLSSVLAHSVSMPLTYAIGVVVSIPLERSARREFMYRRSLRAAKARVVAAARAVNEQNKQMQELVKEKERFFSSAYHDIQQPLAAINLFIRSARTKTKDKEADRDLDVIEETASDILDMFKEIQDYSELGSYVPRLAPVNTLVLLTEVLEQYRQAARSRGIDLRLVRRQVCPPSIETDRSLFKRAVSNLISNAIKSTSSGGVVLGWVHLG